MIRPTLLYDCETWPISVKDEKRVTTDENGAMGHGSEHVAKGEPIAMVTRRLEWFGRVKMSLQDPLPCTGRRRKVRKFY